MAGGGAIGSHKEMTAVINNLKESRVLDKALQTLSLEESYSTKLLDLNNKLVRYKYARLQGNVGKIRSYLSPMEIATLRTQELEGRFKPETPIVSSSTASKIAAAAKRLKLNNYRRAKSAMPRLQKRKAAAPTREEETERSAAPTSMSSRRPSILSDHSEVAAVLCKKLRPHTVADAEIPIAASRLSTPRPSTAAILEKITSAQKARKNLSQQTSYSCHEAKPASASRASQQISDVFGPSPYEVRRRRFLESEHNMSSLLELRKNEFIGETKKFVKDNPPIRDMSPELTTTIIQSIDSMAMRPGSASSRTRSGRSIVDRVDHALLKQFAEIRKTRYLRMEESLLDDSGVPTLAKDQFCRTESWRNIGNKNRVSFKVATAL